MSCLPPWAPVFESCLPAPVEFVSDDGIEESSDICADDKSTEKEDSCNERKTRAFTASTPFTFCSINPVNNSPQARTCVFRGWLFDNHNTGIMIFTTDRRMQKYNQLKANVRFESCFYFEQLKKQFRMQGFVQFLSVDETPQFDNELNTPAVTIQPVKSFTNLAGISGSASPVPGVKTATPNGVAFSSSLSSTLASSASVSTDDLAVTKEPFNYPVYSPAYLNYIDGRNETMQRPSMGPSPEDWKNEYCRIWNSLDSKMKSTFRKPAPKTLLTAEARKKIDSITRGVDGSSDDAGLENFVVVLMFVNQVDYVKLDGIGRRWIYTRIQDDDWKEQEVCP